ncbi:MAG TPA: hypothetical protein VKT77_18090 [Chthonomonadaceae bacterium]|nr:hypothetical protein [Chthonomonadaceae bacterium]
MKPRQHKFVLILLAGTTVVAVGLSFALVARSVQRGPSPAMWAVIAAALATGAAVFVPSLLRRRGSVEPTASLSPADVRFCVLITVVGMALAVFGVFSGMWWIMALGITLSPIAFRFRWPRTASGPRPPVDL